MFWSIGSLPSARSDGRYDQLKSFTTETGIGQTTIPQTSKCSTVMQNTYALSFGNSVPIGLPMACDAYV